MLAIILHLTFLDSKRALKFCFCLACSLYLGFRLNAVFNSDRCTECYGSELCEFFRNRQIQLTWFGYLSSLLDQRWTKSVFHGVLNQSAVVIKRKVGRGEENDLVDDLNNGQMQRVVLCPSVTNKFFLFDQIKGEIREKMVRVDLKTSIEPLLLMYFQSQGTWPFPKYLGACGDLIVEEYKGEPLYSFLSSHFNIRAQLAIHLLEMAHLLTFGQSDLAFYFTDFSLDNLVVDSKGEVFLVDLDSVIIANKSAFKDDQLNKNIHQSEIFDEFKYAFSPLDICSHHLSDHNYFLVCKYLLNHPQDGLLKDIPSDIAKKKELLDLLNECSLPSEAGNRFSAGQSLQFLLKEILHHET